MFKISTAAAALLAAVLVGLACGRSGLNSSASDGAAASGGQPGNTIGSLATGGSGGTIASGGAGGSGMGGTGGLSSPGGAGGTNIGAAGGIIGSGGSNGSGGTAGSSGTGGTGGQGPTCGLYLRCNPGDQQVDTDCPPGRKCYTLGVGCGSVRNTTICAYGADAGASDASTGALDTGVDLRMIATLCGNGVLDPGEQCDDGNTNNGDGCSATCQIEAGWNCPTPGQLCIPCGTNACDTGPVGYCGDGILQTNLGEECDLGPLNGVRSEGDCFLCNTDCRIPPCDI